MLELGKCVRINNVGGHVYGGMYGKIVRQRDNNPYQWGVMLDRTQEIAWFADEELTPVMSAHEFQQWLIHLIETRLDLNGDGNGEVVYVSGAGEAVRQQGFVIEMTDGTRWSLPIYADNGASVRG